MLPLIMLPIISRGIQPYTLISESEEILDEVDFPIIVAELVVGTFHAIVDVSIRQMEAYADLPEKVAKTMDEFIPLRSRGSSLLLTLVDAFRQLFNPLSKF